MTELSAAIRNLLPPRPSAAPTLQRDQHLVIHAMKDRAIIDCRKCWWRADGPITEALPASLTHDCAEYRVPDAEQRAADVARMAPPFGWIDGVAGGNW